MMGRRPQRAPSKVLALAVAIWLGTVPLLAGLESREERSTDLASLAAVARSSPPVLSLLGCLRTILVDFLMVRAEAEVEGGSPYEILVLYETTTKLLPRLEAGWIYLSWNLAFNVPAELDDPSARWGFVRRGIVLCREGERTVAGSWSLPFLEGTILLFRVDRSPDFSRAFSEDAAIDPKGLAPDEAAFRAVWRALSQPGHPARADALASVALQRRSRRVGAREEQLLEDAAALLSHLHRHGEEGRELAAPWEEFLRERGR